MELEPCPSCLVVDAMGRHDPYCTRATQLGLDKLAEGEEPILPEEGTEPRSTDTAEQLAGLEAYAPGADAMADIGRGLQVRIDGEQGGHLSQSPPQPVQALAGALGQLTCVGCGKAHCSSKDRRIGALRIAESCEWRLRYPDEEAWQVIARLEVQLEHARDMPDDPEGGPLPGDPDEEY